MSITAEGLVRNVTKVYSLPSVYLELDRKINDPFANLEDIAAILLEDAGLSARLLRLANSALYSFPSRINTITRAITIIGTNQLRDLALATSVIALFKDIDQSKVNMELFWRHSIGAGIAARVIASYRGETNVERFYLMGLLHDIGRLIMYSQIPEVMQGLIARAHSNVAQLHDEERAALGFDHGRVGMLLLQGWRLPAQLVEAVGYHHTPVLSRSYALEASIVHVADILVNAAALGCSSGSHRVPKLDARAWEALGLSSALIPDILERVEQQYHDAVEIFLS